MRYRLYGLQSRSSIAALAAVGLALLSVTARAQSAGAQAYSIACQRCHNVAQVLRWMGAYPDAARRMRYLDSKLTKHYAADVKLRAEIVAYLEAEYLRSIGDKRVDAE